MVSRPAAGGGRLVDVPAARLIRWLDGFHERHRVLATDYSDPDAVVFEAADGAVARCRQPLGRHGEAGRRVGFAPLPLLAHVSRPLVVGVLLVRLGGYAVGVFESDAVVASTVDSRLVHGRHRNGGSSAGRFARRRANQARELISAAADTAARILLPRVSTMDACVVGGDRSAVDAVLADRRVHPLRPLLVEPFLDVPDPKRAVLDAAPVGYRTTRVHVLDGDLS